MAASLQDIAEWFERGKQDGATHLIVVCDTFDHDDYPVYTSEPHFWQQYDAYNGKNMQRIMEVYDLRKPWSEQTKGRVWNVPPRPSAVTQPEKP